MQDVGLASEGDAILEEVKVMVMTEDVPERVSAKLEHSVPRTKCAVATHFKESVGKIRSLLF